MAIYCLVQADMVAHLAMQLSVLTNVCRRRCEITAKEWTGRKESHIASVSDLFSGGDRTQLSDDKGRHVDA